MNIFKILALCGVAVVCAIAIRVLVPYYQGEQDAPIESESRHQVSTIVAAINRFVEQNPEHRFPSNLTEVTSLTVLGTTNLEVFCGKFVYLPPPPRASKRELFGRVVLIEKLGHYKYRRGGYGGIAGDTGASNYSLGDYKTLAEKNGLSIEQLSEK